jgi:hypothetical protein
VRLVKAIFDIRYASAPAGLDIGKNLHTAIVGKEPEENLTVFSTNFSIQDKKTAVSVTDKFTQISVESKDVKESLNEIITLYEKLTAVVGFDTASRVALRGIYFHEHECEFDALIETYKQTYFTQNKLIQEAVDVAVVTTSRMGDYHVNFSSGPMSGNEIADRFLGFPYDGELPPVYSCLDLDFSLSEVKLSTKRVAGFLKETTEAHKKFVKNNLTEVQP